MTGGDLYGMVHENTLVKHKLLLPPRAKGTVTYIADPAEYTVDVSIIENGNPSSFNNLLVCRMLYWKPNLMVNAQNTLCCKYGLFVNLDLLQRNYQLIIPF